MHTLNNNVNIFSQANESIAHKWRIVKGIKEWSFIINILFDKIFNIISSCFWVFIVEYFEKLFDERPQQWSI